MDKNPPKPPLSLIQPKNNVHALEGKKLKADPEIVMMLTDMLDKAKVGQLQALCTVFVLADPTQNASGLGSYWGGAMDDMEINSMIGQLSCVQAQMIHAVNTEGGTPYDPSTGKPQSERSEEPPTDPAGA